MTKRTRAEQAVYDLFIGGNAGYGAYGICANPNCDHRDETRYCMGTHPMARICIECFEFEFRTRHPSRKKIEALRASASTRRRK